MKVILIIVAVTILTIMTITIINDEKKRMELQVRKYRIKIADLEHRLALSGNDKYLSDAKVATSEYYNVCRERDVVKAENAGLNRQIEVLNSIIDQYISGSTLTTLESVHGITQRHNERDSQGKFVPTKANESEESKAVRAYRMDVNGMEKSLIASKLNISESSVKTYIGMGRRELAEQYNVIFYDDKDVRHSVPADFVNEYGAVYIPDKLEKYKNAWDEKHKAAFDSIKEYYCESEKNG